jgi:hypothetical protein
VGLGIVHVVGAIMASRQQSSDDRINLGISQQEIEVLEEGYVTCVTSDLGTYLHTACT